MEVSLPSLAEPLYRDRIKELLPADAASVPVASFGIDELQAYETSEGTYFFLREGNKTLCIQHCGTGDPMPYAERFAAFLEEENPWPFLSE